MATWAFFRFDPHKMHSGSEILLDAIAIFQQYIHTVEEQQLQPRIQALNITSLQTPHVKSAGRRNFAWYITSRNSFDDMVTHRAAGVGGNGRRQGD